MNWNSNPQNNNPYTAAGYEKSKITRVVLVAASLIVVILLLSFLINFAHPKSQQDKYIQSAKTAAKKHTPNASVKSIRVAGGFALATVSSSSTTSQASAGNTTVFKVNKDGSMEQIADGSSFSPLDLLELRIPLSTQAKLTSSTLEQVKQDLADQCGFDDGAPGYSGFGGSFSPGEWQIDSATLSSLEQALSYAISNQYNNVSTDKAVVCVNALQKGSNATTDTKTYVSTFALQVQFVTADGTVSNHTVTFSIGSNYYRSFTLDRQTI